MKTPWHSRKGELRMIMRMAGWLALTSAVVVVAICFARPAGAGEGGTSESQSDIGAALERLAGRMHWLPPELLGLSVRLRPGVDAEDVRHLVEHARSIPLRYGSAKDPTVRGLVALVYGLSDDLEQMSAAASLLKDDATTGLRSVPMPTVMYGGEPNWDSGIKLTVSDLARTSLNYRWMGGALSVFPFDLAKDAQTFAEACRSEQGGSGEWVYRFRLAVRWKLDRDKLKSKLLKEPGPTTGIAAAAIAAYVKDQLTDEEVALAFGNADKKRLIEFLQNKWRMGTMVLPSGPYSKDQMEVRQVILRVASKVFAKEDAQWLYNAANPTEWVSVYYIIAASRLDPGMGVGWLKKAIEKEPDQLRRCELLEALCSVGGEGELSYIRDRYFAESKPEYNAGGLQENLIERVGKSGGDTAAPLLKALVLDKRFTTLGWAVTRAFAQNAIIILGADTVESRRYLGVQHRMGVYGYEKQPELRDRHLVDTKHVLMQTEAFQAYLQGEVFKRSRQDDRQKGQ